MASLSNPVSQVKRPPVNGKLRVIHKSANVRGKAQGLARPGKKNFNPGSPVKLQSREHEIKALDLRKKGYSYSDIGKALGISTPSAFNAVMRVLAAYEQDIQERVPQVRQMELLRLDAHEKALSAKCAAGDTKAIMTALQVSARRAKLMGLDAPTQMVHSGEVSAVVKMSDEELERETATLIVALGISTPAVITQDASQGGDAVEAEVVTE